MEVAPFNKHVLNVLLRKTILCISPFWLAGKSFPFFEIHVTDILSRD